MKNKIIPIISILIFVMSLSSSVFATKILEDYPPSCESKNYTLNDMSNIINEIYNLDIDLSTFTNASELSKYLTNEYTILITTYVDLDDGNKEYPYILAARTNSSNPQKIFFYHYKKSSGHIITPYNNRLSYAGIIKTSEKSINQSIGWLNDNHIYNRLKNGKMLRYESQSSVTLEEFYSQDYLDYVFYEIFEWYSGPFYDTDIDPNLDGYQYYNLDTLLNKQEHNKKTYYSQSDGSYVSGDINLYDDFVTVKNLETNFNGDLYISVVKYPIIKNKYGNYVIGENIEFETISTINVGSETQEWTFSNPFEDDVEDCIYAVGIGAESAPFAITSEWFNANLNQRDFMFSNPFRLSYYVEDLTNLFIEDNGNQGGSTGSGDSGEVIPPVQDEELEIENGYYPSLMTLYLNGLIPKDTTKPEYISKNYLGEHYYKVDFEVLLDTQAIYNLNRLKIVLGIYKANIDKENRKITYSQIGTKYADAMAVYESAKERFGHEVYDYDLFNIWNCDGEIDTYINEYGIDNIAFSLHLFDTKIGYMDTYKDYLAFNKEWTIEVSGDNTIIGNDKVETDTDISINADSSFWNLLEETKKFIDKFLSFFDIFPGWLISLISTAVIVAIICRIIGR